ncbi:MAG: phosphate signaling complex protein PhoU [Brevinema sp.]
MIVDRKISKTKERILHYINLVNTMIEQTITASIAEDWEKVQEVYGNLEDEANYLQMDIAQDCLGILALYHPEAINLRYIVKMSGMVNDLERIGDLASKIAMANFHWKDQYSLKDYPMIIEMSQETNKMLSRLHDTFVEEDTLKAVAIIQQDDKVDELCTKTLRSLIKAMNCTQEVEPLIQIMNVAKHLERIADICGHFAEDIVFIKEGLIPNKEKK